jgi:TFIIF-interacting CTD phosphatase-like protein
MNKSDSISLEWLHSGLVANKEYAVEMMYNKDNKTLIDRKKLRLVLDLDETLIHAIQLPNVFEDRMDEEDAENINYPIFPVNNKWDKFSVGNTEFVVYLRPNVEEFLSGLSPEFFEIYVYTHGTVSYANQVLAIIKKRMEARQMDFAVRGVSARSTRHRIEKKLARMLCKRSTSIVIDDNPSVWCQDDQGSILKISPYLGSSQDDELDYLSEYLKRIHKNYFQMPKEQADVRTVLLNLASDD